MRLKLFEKLTAAMTALFVLVLAGGAMAQSAALKGFDTDQPIEILADSLEVQQQQQTATFAGNVQVLQGEIRLKAQKLIVHYADSNAKTASGEEAPQIRKIDAIGDVFLSSPRETAKGNQGIYDVINKQIQLNGAVVLTQGQNVLRGEQMVLDLVSGRSRIVGTGTGNTGGRVRGIFVPQKKN
ncbi:lipopolysaccharide transport periplasmic protein LptA [Sneathiella sp. P13V-1]|uniref:lipopolysaccharide transport periplasmic protein LptA n=1 Tax=Sneathiella sp. P13V-1 TaxID=2697366 RepID=UPI00187B4D9B|nr:lipopolysaccharide transport periplasmic protein LptA [Sneathiella sp. P13V-1]MBE7636131.1 lipopolysaccharide transport periplasmic protein LptA [Sneathiella sp. P13V-1]